uniref:Ig-like domain-containing protein n=1 Tax=Neolamprologus brichardi TaxID=32507 RepID=A0A3Q4I9N5_NEOBR
AYKQLEINKKWKIFSLPFVSDVCELAALLFLLSGQKTITADTGQSITLSCQAANSSIIVVEWSRADLGDKYVFLYRDDQSLQDKQHPSFTNRVDLQDKQMKDGDVSLILKNVTINDNGTYECHVFMEKTWISLCNITLSVDPPGE